MLVSSGFVAWNYWQLDESVYQDRRELSHFSYHISDFPSCWFWEHCSLHILREEKSLTIQLAGFAISIWFIVVVFILRSVSGIGVLLSALAAYYLWYLLNERNRKKVLLGLGAGVVFIGFVVLIVIPPISSFFQNRSD